MRGGAWRTLTDLDPVDLLTRAVAIASPSGAERPVADFLVDAMRAFCRDAYVDEAGNALGHWGSGALRLWLLGHIDTVRGHIDVRVADGVLHGRGAVDAKGSFCAFIAAVARLPRELERTLSITLIGAVGVAAPGSVGARHAVATLPRPDLVVIGEPSGWDGITLGYKGSMQVELSTRQPSRHSAVDEATAAERVVEAYAAVRASVEALNAPAPAGDGQDGAAAVSAGAATESAPRFGRLQLRLLEFTTTEDGLESRARARLGFRVPPDVSASALAERLAGVVAASAVRFEALPDAVDAVRTDKAGTLPAAFRSAIRSVGGTPRHKLKTGTSDMNVVAAAWRAGGLDVPPMVAYGPGDSGLDHTPGERVELGEYLTAISVLERAVANLATGAGGGVVEGLAGAARGRAGAES